MKLSVDWTGAEFRKSTKSSTDGDDKCVEVAFIGTKTGVKDSKDKSPDRFNRVIEFSPDSWRAFLVAVPKHPDSA